MGCSGSRNKLETTFEVTDNLGADEETAKIVIIGNSKVGKTSLLKSYLSKRPYNDPSPEQSKKEIVKKVSIAQDDGTAIKLDMHIWESTKGHSS